MYYPYLRGKQFELIALRELLRTGTLYPQVTPIIEPIKASSTLKSTLLEFSAAKHPIAVIQNPNAAAYEPFDDEEVTALKHEQFFIPAQLVKTADDVKPFAAFPNQTHLAIITQQPDFDSTFADALWQTAIKVIDLRQRRLLKRAEKPKVELEDGFEKQARNSDYARVDDEEFSQNHLDYADDGLTGFSDYSVIGADYSDKGFAPLAVALHIVYFDEADHLRIHHFVSDSNEDITDPAGKFGEAVGKLVRWYEHCDREKNDSAGIREFVRLYEQGQYQGLGAAKKLSIEHHLEIMGRFLAKGV